MTYGLNLGLFVGNGPTVHPATGGFGRGSSSGLLAWRSLDEDRRIALVEQALADAANDDLPDGFPAAL